MDGRIWSVGTTLWRYVSECDGALAVSSSLMMPLALFLLTLLIGMTTDIRARRVPNVLVLCMLGLGVVAGIAHWSPAASALAAIAGLAVGLAIWMPFWLLGLLGAGDVKYFAAASAWVGPPLAWRAAIVAALLGGVMGVLTLLWQRGFRRTASHVVLQYQQAAHVIASADVSNAEAKARTFPYAVPMGVALGAAAIRPSLLLAW